MYKKKGKTLRQIFVLIILIVSLCARESIALEDAQKVSCNNDIIKCYNLASNHAKGINGVAVNYEIAHILYKKVCDLDDTAGCSDLAYMYERGMGVKPDATQALKLYKKACLKGNGIACENAGSLCISNNNSNKAIIYFMKACEKDQPLSCKNLAFIRYNDKSRRERADFDYVMGYLNKACKLKDQEACQWLQKLQIR